MSMAELHSRASQWYEDNGLEIEAFHHAAAANDIERAERLIIGGRIPQHSRAAVTAVFDWLDSLPRTVLDARPWLWVRSATVALNAGRTTGVEEKLQAAEEALQNADLDDKTRDLIGQIAAVRATLALADYQPEAMINQAHRALEYLHPDNLPFRGRAFRTLGFALPAPGGPCRGPSGLYRSQSYQTSVREYLTSRYQLQPAWAMYRNLKTSSIRRPKPTDAPCNYLVISHLRMLIKSSLAWLAYSMNGTIWMPLNSTGSRAFNWRGSMIARSTDSSSVKCSWPA